MALSCPAGGFAGGEELFAALGAAFHLAITQAQVARHMGISQSALSNLEAGNSPFALSQLTRYAETLGVVIDFTITAREAAA